MSLELMRVIFPRWNFFDRVGYQLILEVKQVGTKGWLPISFTAPRTLGGLFTNPEVTRLHAEMSLLENFVQDVHRITDAKGEVDPMNLNPLTSYKMVRAMVMNRLMAASASDVQFRVSAKAGAETVVIFTSHTVKI